MLPYQTIGNVCAAIAVVLLLWPLQHLLWAYSHEKAFRNGWEPEVLFVLIPQWLLLMGGLLCVTASGGFDELRLGRPALYALTIATAVSLAVVCFVLVAMFIQPGFSPRVIYVPLIVVVPLATALLICLSLNPRLALGSSLQWLRWPWTAFAALSLVACVGFFGSQLVRTGLGSLAGIVHRIQQAHDNAPAQMAEIARLDPQTDFGFAELLKLADGYHDSAVRETATARLRSVADFPARLAAELAGSRNEPALAFVQATTLSPEEKALLALPTRAALQRFTGGIPAPNYMPPERRKQLLKWGRKTFADLARKFEGTGVDFAPTLAAFEHALRPDDSRR